MRRMLRLTSLLTLIALASNWLLMPAIAGEHLIHDLNVSSASSPTHDNHDMQPGSPPDTQGADQHLAHADTSKCESTDCSACGGLPVGHIATRSTMPERANIQHAEDLISFLIEQDPRPPRLSLS